MTLNETKLDKKKKKKTGAVNRRSWQVNMVSDVQVIV